MKSPIKVALAIVYKNSQILICQRVATTHLGGLWEFPGGKILTGEAPEAAALRELREETAVAAAIMQEWPVIEFIYPDRTVRLHPFLCEYISGRAQAIGCQQVKWIDVAALRNHEFPPANEVLLQRLESLNLPA